MVQLSSYLTTVRTVLTIQTFVSKVMSLLFNTLSRFVTAFLPRSKRLSISWLQSPSAVVLEPKKIVGNCFHFSPHLFAMKWWNQMPWPLFFECWVSNQLFSLLFYFNQEALEFFIFCHKGGVICISEVIDISPAILIPACASSSLAFHLMYSAYKLN